MVLKGIDFEVRDAKTGEDLTRSILLQIILEEETGGVPMFSTSMLAQIIRFYGHAMQGMMGSYLEKNLQTFTDIQARIAEQSKGLYDPKAQSPEIWSQFLSGQAPMVQNLMGNYLEQSRQVFLKMQEQMDKQARRSSRAWPGAPRRPSADERAGARPAFAARRRRVPAIGENRAMTHEALDLPADRQRRAEDRLRLARLPEGADRFRADPDAPLAPRATPPRRPSPAPTW